MIVLVYVVVAVVVALVCNYDINNDNDIND